MRFKNSIFLTVALSAVLACGTRPKVETETGDPKSDTGDSTGDTGTEPREPETYTVGDSPTGTSEATNGAVLGNVFLAQGSGTLESFEWHHAGTNPSNCRIDFYLLSRTDVPEVDGFGWWAPEWNSLPMTPEDKGTNAEDGVTSSGEMNIQIDAGKWYMTAVFLRDCAEGGELLYSVQRNADGPTDVGFGEMIGFGSTASYEEEENGSFSGIRYREEYTAPYQMTLYVTKN